MKTGLVTFYHIHHYGALLQAYATERAVESLGSECEIIDYYVNQDNSLFRRPTGLGSAAHDAHTALHYGPLKARYERFERFARERLRISGHRYESLEELRQAELPYDVLLSGSDQIWNPKIFPERPVRPGVLRGLLPQAKDRLCPILRHPRIPEEMEEELAGVSAPVFPPLRPGAAGPGHCPGHHREGRAGGAGSHAAAGPAAVGGGGGAIPHAGGYILCYCISRPGALEPLHPPSGGGDGAAGGAAVRHPPEGPPQGPLRTGRRSGRVSGVVPGGQRGVHQLLPRDRVFHPVPKALLYRRGAGGAGIAGEFPDLQPALYPGPHGADHRQGRYCRTDRRDRLCRRGAAAGTGPAGGPWTIFGAPSPVRPREEEAGPAQVEPASDHLPELADHIHCTGCTACANSCPKDAITMERDREGFAYPVVDLGAVCPLRPLHRCVPCAAHLGAGASSGGVRSLEPG